MPKKKVKRGLVSEVGLSSQVETVEVNVPEEKTLHEELVEINDVLKHMLEVLKDIEYNTHDRTGFWKGRR